MKGASALLLGGFLASCSHEEFDISTYVADKVKAYEQVFTSEFGSIDPNQDWGFGSSTRGLTRAVFGEHWDGVHNSTSSSKVPCGVYWTTDTIPFTIPSDLVTVESTTTIAPGKNYYVPSNFNGKVKFGDNYSGSIYVAGTVTGYEGGNQGNVNIYIYDEASWTSSFTTGTVNFYNNGFLTLGGSDLQNSNIAAIYNAGSFTYTGTNTNNSTYFYSTGTVELTADNVDFKLKSDIHNTMKCKNVKIQNGTAKYICGIEATGKVENVDGPLVTSNVIATEFSFDGNPIYLTQGGHINVGTLKIPNSNCHVYAVTGSTALVEATNFEFGNKNDFTHTFSDNIYFKVKGGYIKVDNCYAMGSSHDFATVDEYLAYEGHSASQSDEYALAKDRINAGSATGSPACGSAWSIGTATPVPNDTIPVDDQAFKKSYYQTTKLIESGRVFCEDLGRISSNDLDFNDVVFDAYIYEITYSTKTTDANGESRTIDTGTDYECDIFLLAAGGTLPLSVAGQEVHDAFGVGTETIINTINDEKGSYGNTWVTDTLPRRLQGTYSSIEDIPVVTQYANGTILMLKANKGEVPHKFCVPIDTPWAKERAKMDLAYPDFYGYVNNNKTFSSNGKSEYLYSNIKYDYSPQKKEEDGTYLIKEETSGGYNGTPVLSRPAK